MAKLSKITASAIVSVFITTDELQVPDDYDYCEKVKITLLLQGYYCTKIDYEQHIEFLVDCEILGRGQFGKLYFLMNDNNQDKSITDITLLINEKLNTLSDKQETEQSLNNIINDVDKISEDEDISMINDISEDEDNTIIDDILY